MNTNLSKMGIKFCLIFIGLFASSSCGGDGNVDVEGAGAEVSGISDVTATLSPPDGAVDISCSTTVAATFSDSITTPNEEDDWSSIFSLVAVGGDGTNLCTPEVITFAEGVATCAPTSLETGEQYTTGISGLTDSSGKSIPDTTATFTVERVRGDLNADCYADLLIGAASPNAVYLHLGGESMDTLTDFTFTGGTDSLFGAAVSSHGDFNGDSFYDALIGAPYLSWWGAGADHASIYYGGTGMDDDADVTFTDGGGTDSFGRSVSSGDFNGDGYDDAIIGAQNTAGGDGRAFVYYGSETMEAAADVTITGGTSGFGSAVSSGDLNGDGYDDAIVGAAGGSVYLYFGSSGGLAADPAVTLSGGAENVFGSAVSAGDFNGDSYDDLLVGASQWNEGDGRAYIFYGGAGGVDTTADVTITGETGSELGSVLSAGDFNGDGIDDAMIADHAPFYDVRKTYIYFGAASGMDTTADVILSGEIHGISISAGDINGDGFADAIVGGSPDGNSSHVFVYFGGASMSGVPIPDVSFGITGTSVAGGSR